VQRRDFLLGAAGATWAASADWAGADDRQESGRSSLRVVLRLGGETLTFDEAKGEDLGDFHGPKFVQRCIRVTKPGVPLTVFFRPDRDSSRVEVVVELGRLWGEANAQAAELGAYRAQVLRGDKVLAEVAVPRHHWFSRWRWQSAPRPVITKAASLIASGFLPLPFDAELLRYCKPTKPATFAGPMDDAGVTRAMHTTGDRGDIGPITEWQAEYLATGRSAALTSLLAQGEAAGSIPWNLRDETTGAPPSLYDHPRAGWSIVSAGQNFEWIRQLDGKPREGGWQIDIAHQPSLCYVPYLLTGDPYYLEGLQFQVNTGLLVQPTARQRERLPVVSDAQVRGYAWGLRTLAQATRVTPEKTPRWLLPRAHWARIFEDNRTYFNRRYVEGKLPTFSVLHAFWAPPDDGGPNDYRLSTFQQDFLTFVVGWIVRMGFESWRPAFAWCLESAIARTGGSRDWPRQFCAPYLLPLFRDSKGEEPISSWAEAWTATKAYPPNGYTEPFPPEPQFAQKIYWGYQIYTQAALAMGVRLGIDKARAGYEWCRLMTLDGLNRGRPMSARWAFLPDASRAARSAPSSSSRSPATSRRRVP
jgi:hypothetical protein